MFRLGKPWVHRSLRRVQDIPLNSNRRGKFQMFSRMSGALTIQSPSPRKEHVFVEPNLHPVQLRFVAIKELFMQSFWPPTNQQDFESPPAEISHRICDYDPNSKSIQIGLHLSMGIDHEPTEAEIAEFQALRKLPFRLRVHLVAEFEVDPSQFPLDKLQHWAKVNAPMIMMPFLREHVYSLTGRVGYRPIILPMMLVPAFQIQKNQEPQRELDLAPK